MLTTPRFAHVDPSAVHSARLQADDLDWRAGRIALRGKASRDDWMPLPAHVGEALSAYLRHAQPPASTRRKCYLVPSVAVDVEPGRIGHPGFIRQANFNLSVTTGDTIPIRLTGPSVGPIIR